MNEGAIIQAIAEQIKAQFEGEGTGHDWYHIQRVWRNAKQIAEHEACNQFIVEIGALLHDIADHKFVEDFVGESEKRTRTLLAPFQLSNETVSAILHIVHNCSFKGGVGENKMKSIEGLIVQDADRLDALGAIGIARAFAYGGSAGSMIYDPEVKPTDFKTEEAYRKSRTHTINHFYEKLLLLKDLMNTKTGKSLALERHKFMDDFLAQFYKEWEGQV